MKKSITVKELMEQLKTLTEMGYGEYEVFSVDRDDIERGIERGVWDTLEEEKMVIIA
jgi:hypothetical protein